MNDHYKLPFVITEERDDSEDYTTDAGFNETFPETFPNLHSIFQDEKQSDSDQEHGMETAHPNGSNQSKKVAEAKQETGENNSQKNRKYELSLNKSPSSIATPPTKPSSNTEMLTEKVTFQGNVAITPARFPNDVKSEGDSMTTDVKPIEDLKEGSIDTKDDRGEIDCSNSSIPDGNKPGNSCPVCKVEIHNKQKLNFHMRKYHIIEPVCNLCRRRLKNVCVLKKHLRRLHNQEFYEMRPEQVNACQVSFFFNI